MSRVARTATNLLVALTSIAFVLILVLGWVGYSDLAPAILRLAGHDSGQRSRLADLLRADEPTGYSDEEAEAIVRERLSGLGYIG